MNPLKASRTLARRLSLAGLFAVLAGVAHAQLVTPPTVTSVTPPPSTASYGATVTIAASWQTNFSNTGSWNTGTQTCFSWFECYVTGPTGVPPAGAYSSPLGALGYNVIGGNQSEVGIYIPSAGGGNAGAQNYASSSFNITLNQAGVWTIYLETGDGRPWYGTTTSYTVTVSSQPLTGVAFNSSSYTGSPQTPTVASTAPGGATYSTNYTAETVPGTYNSNQEGITGTGSYSGTVYGSWTISPASQAITFTNPGTQTYGVAPFALSASAPGGTVTFSVASGPATISGTTITITGAGTVVVSANQSGNADYNAAPQVQQSFTVNPKPLTAVTFNPATYSGSAQTPTVASVTPSGATYTTSYSAQTTAGGYSESIVGSGNYSGTVSATWTINPEALTSVTITGPNTYTGSALTPTYTTVPAGGIVTFAPATETNAGTYAPTWTASGNFSGSGTASWTVGKAAQAISAVASPTSTYSDLSSTVTASGGAGSGAFSYSIQSGPGAVNSSTGYMTPSGIAGTVVVLATKAADSNYLAATATASVTVSVFSYPTPGNGVFANSGAAYRDALAGSPTSATATFSLTNSGGSPLTVTSISAGGAPFAITTNPGLPFTIPANTTMSGVITVTFTPASIGSFTGILTVVASTNTATAGEAGTGIAPIISISWQ